MPKKKRKSPNIIWQEAVRGRTRRKYNNRKVEYDGITFDSVKESEWYKILKHDESIEKIECHVKFLLLDTLRYDGKTYRKISYYPDFVVTYKDGRKEVIEVKGGKATRTSTWRIKWHLFITKYGDQFDNIRIV